MALDLNSIGRSRFASDEMLRKLAEQGFIDAPELVRSAEPAEPVEVVRGGLELCWPGPLRLPKKKLARFDCLAHQSNVKRVNNGGKFPEPLPRRVALPPVFDEPLPDEPRVRPAPAPWVGALLYLALVVILVLLAVATCNGGGSADIAY